jgi:hypothetical protein
VGGPDANVLTIDVTGAPVITAGSSPVDYGSSTFIHSVSATFRDRPTTSTLWDPSPANVLGAGGVPLGVSRVPSSTAAVPFTLTADGSGGGAGTITFSSVTRVVTGTAGAAVPGAVVFVSAVGGTGGGSGDAAAATRVQATATSTGAFAMTLTKASPTTTIQLRQEIQRTATSTLTSAASASLAAQPVILASSSLGGTVDGEMTDGDTITLNLSGAVTTAGLTSFDVAVSRNTPNVITVRRAGTAQVVVTITTTGVRYNVDASETMTFDASPSVWSAGGTVLTITLDNGAGGTTAVVGTAHASVWVAGAALVDTNGIAISTSPVTAATSRF